MTELAPKTKTSLGEMSKMTDAIVRVNERVLVRRRGRRGGYVPGRVLGFSVDGIYVLVETDDGKKNGYAVYDVFVPSGYIYARER
jgi:hypothetical protein